MKQQTGFGSLCVKEWPDKKTTKPHILPLYATSSFEFENIEQGINIFTGKEEGHVYGRYGNPTIETVAEKIAAMETHGLDLTAYGMLFSSGMSAISSLMMTLVKSGDKVLTQGNLYGGTTELLMKVLSRMGVETILADLKNLDKVEDLLKNDPSIRLLYFETPANPTLACIDIEALSSIAKKYDRWSAVDNTFCTPFLQQPFRFGTDFIVHSTTKFLNGHGNSIAGIVIGKDGEIMQNQLWDTMRLVGTNANPFDAWLINSGLKTLELRMLRHSENGMAVANFLESHEKVGRVNYNGLASHPDHQLAKKQMRDFGAMLSFELKEGLEAGIRFMNRIRFASLAPTLGDVDTLILHPASMSHRNIAKEIRLRNGITDGLIRISIGIENSKDIIADLGQALDF